MKVRVTERNIRYGAPKNPETCAIALAVRELVKLGVSVNVTGAAVILTKTMVDSAGTIFSNGPINVELPELAQQFVLNFDDRLYLGPIEFDLDIPQEYLKDVIAPTVIEPEPELVGV